MGLLDEMKKLKDTAADFMFPKENAELEDGVKFQKVEFRNDADTFYLRATAEISKADFHILLRNAGLTAFPGTRPVIEFDVVPTKDGFNQIFMRTQNGLPLNGVNAAALRRALDDYLYQGSGKSLYQTLQDGCDYRTRQFERSVSVCFTSIKSSDTFMSALKCADKEVAANLLGRSGMEIGKGDTPVLVLQGIYTGEQHDVTLSFDEALFAARIQEDASQEKCFIHLSERERSVLTEKADAAVKEALRQRKDYAPQSVRRQEQVKTNRPIKKENGYEY